MPGLSGLVFPSLHICCLCRVVKTPPFRPLLFWVEVFANVAEDFQEHPVGEFTGKRILLAGMVRSEETRQRMRQSVDGAMAEWKRSEAGNVLLIFQQAQISP